MNWNYQGINSKLDQLLDLFKAHDVHFAILTETQRTIGVERNKQIQTLKGYTFYFSSYVDTSHSAFFMPTRLREWGVCIAIRVGLAYQSVTVDNTIFKARVLHGTLTIPTHTTDVLTMDIIAVYAPAREEMRPAFWSNLDSYVSNLAHTINGSSNRHLVLVGDWNSCLDLERDIYRLDPLASTSSNQNKYLKNFLATLTNKGLPMFDPMARDKLSALSDFTYSTADGRYRSILDKIFTSFSHGHCNKTQILSWSRHTGVKYSDHRPALTRINLSTLCHGWIEYPLQPLQRPRVKIEPAAVSDDQKQELKANITKWHSCLSPAVQRYLYPSYDPALPPLPDVTDSLLCEMHFELTKLFVDIPGSVFETGSSSPESKVYKTKTAGSAQHILCWLKRYKVSLVNLLDLKRHRGHRLCKSQRRTARRVAADFHSDPRIHSSLPELSPLLSLHVRDWTEACWHSHMHKVKELHGL
jgi:exonuclease III